MITFCSYSLSFAQGEFNNKIIDSENSLALSNAMIINIKTKDTLLSNANGYFKNDEAGLFLIKKTGYQEKRIELNNETYNIIQLEIKPSELNEIIINNSLLPKKLNQATSAISIITSKDIEQSNNIDFAPIINKTSGVFMQNAALNTNRITIRGIGARNLFGTSKIRAYFKDIPLTNGSGETTIEAVSYTHLTLPTIYSV